MFGFAKVFGVAKNVKAMPFALTPAYLLPKREAVTLMENCTCCGEAYPQEDCRYVQYEVNDWGRVWEEGYYYNGTCEK